MSRILIIEDDPATRRQLVQLLRFEGFQVIEVESGQAGIQAAKSAPPDLVICDIMMPGLDGFGVLQALRDDPATALLPFVFLTARVEARDARSAMNYGADDYITKPFEPDTFLAAVRQRLKRREQQLAEVQRRATDVSLAVATSIPEEIRGCLDHIERVAGILTLQPDERTESLDMARHAIQQEVERLRRIIRRLQLYAQMPRLYARRFELSDRIRTDEVESVVRQAAAAAAREWARGADLCVEVEAATPAIQSDHLALITHELVGNACKFSLAGTPVRVLGERKHGYWSLRVVDCGAGMTPRQIAEIGAFKQFWTGEARPAGLGLGLALAQGLARFAGGEFSIESDPNGTAACVMLPGE